MIPILYEGTETSFISNGLGRLADAISCKVVEERNATYELEMQYPVSGAHYEDIQENRIILAQPFDGGLTQPFLIYKITRPINGIVTINAEHISYRLSGITVMPYTANSATSAMAGIKTYSATTNPFSFSTDKSVTANFTFDSPKTARELLCGSSGSILDVYGKGDYEFNRFDVILRVNRGSDNGVTLRYGKNITDLTSVIDTTNTYTGICPYWTDGSGNTVTLPEKVIMSGYETLYPYTIIKPVDFSGSFEEAPTEVQLRSKAQSYVESNQGWVLKNNITISFVALWNTEEYKDIAPLERVKMCDVVHIQHPKMGIDFSVKVIRTDYDVLQEKYNSITLGDTYYTLDKYFEEEIIEAQADQTSFMSQSIARATKLIQGGLGGYVVFNTNADGEPQEILIMDHPDIHSAVNVIRMNKNGIGFSITGYNGPFTTAWTIDGHFAADFIDTGTLNANLIKVGRIQDAQNKNYWDMTTGEFRLSATTTVGNETVQNIADRTLSTWVNSTYADDMTDLEAQVDKKAETWYQSSNPAIAWNTTALKAQHVGDLWYKTTDGTTWFYNGSYQWVQQDVPMAVFDQIDGKAQIFTSQPTPPYNKGDLWCVGESGDILTCIVAKTAGQSYARSDWAKRNKYTDDSALSTWIAGTYSTDKTNLLTQVDQKAETWYQATDPSRDWVTAADKKKHVGDLWYKTTNGTTWFYDSTYKWIEQAVPDEVFDQIDGKAQVFVSTPQPPYAIGDIWFVGTTGDILTCIRAKDETGSFASSDWAKKNKYTDDSTLNTWLTNTYGPDKTELQSQIDKKAQTWYQSSNPASSWTTTALKKQHVGDLWYKTTDGTTWYYNSSYTWVQQDVPDVVFDKIDGKAQIFVAQPVPPYETGDLWCVGSTGDILTCIRARSASESYSSSDWEKRNKYTDDTTLNNWLTNTYGPDKTNLTTQLDKKAETWYQSSNPASAWTTTALKKQHVGDLWYKTTDGTTWFYNSSYTWVQENVPSVVFDKIDGKAQIFTSTPTPPYSKGDLWCVGSSGDILTCITAKASGQSYSSSDWAKRNKYTDDSSLNSWISGTYSEDKTSLQTQVDKKAETWYQSSNPASSWTTTALKKQHVGDLWYKTSDGTTWFYNSSYTWVQQNVPNSVFDKIDGKAQIFTSQPTPPYYVGDLWCQGSSGDIVTCVRERTSGSYTASDWSKLNNYIDTADVNSAISAYDDDLDQAAVFNKLTNNGTAQGIILQNGKLYINATWIGTGTLTDSYGRTNFNLETGALSTKKFSVTSTNFNLTESGLITATGATLSGKFTCGSDGSKESKVELDSGSLKFYYQGTNVSTLTTKNSRVNSYDYGTTSLVSEDIWLAGKLKHYTAYDVPDPDYNYIELHTGTGGNYNPKRVVIHSPELIALTVGSHTLEVKTTGVYIDGTRYY